MLIVVHPARNRNERGEYPLEEPMGRHPESFRSARTCYDHLAGRLGVQVAHALCGRGVLNRSGGEFVLTATGRQWLGGFGIDVAAIDRGHRNLVRSCRDLTEAENHVAGALGAAIAARLLELGWVERQSGGRVLKVSAAGKNGLRRELGIDPVVSGVAKAVL